MDKLLTLKDWHTPKNAAKLLSSMFEVGVSEADIFQFVLEGKLSVCVNFVNPVVIVVGRGSQAETKARLEADKIRGKGFITHPVVPVWKMNSSFSDELNQAIVIEHGSRPEYYTPAEKGLSYSFDLYTSTTGGVCPLAPIGSGRYLIKREFERLTSKTNVSIPKEPLYLDGGDGTLAVIHASHQIGSNSEQASVVIRNTKNRIALDNLKHKESRVAKICLSDEALEAAIWYLPTNKLPEDSYFVIDTDSIMNLVSEAKGESLPKQRFDKVARHAGSDPEDGLVVGYENSNIQELANKAAAQYIREHSSKDPSKDKICKIIFDGGLVFKKHGDPAPIEYILRNFKKTWPFNENT